MGFLRKTFGRFSGQGKKSDILKSGRRLYRGQLPRGQRKVKTQEAFCPTTRGGGGRESQGPESRLLPEVG